MNVPTGSLNWRYDFEAASDDMAQETAKRCLKYDQATRTALGVVLYSNERVLADYIVRCNTEVIAA